MADDEAKGARGTSGAARVTTASNATTGTKARTTSASKTTPKSASKPASNDSAHDGALAEERRKLAAAEAALAQERAKLARVEEDLERERRRADTATAALETAHKHAAPPPPEARPEPRPDARPEAKREAEADKAPPWLRPLENLPGAELFATGQRMAQQMAQTAQSAMKQPWNAVRQSSELFGEAARILTGQSEIKPGPGDKRFTDTAWEFNPVYKAALQTYLLWRQSLHGFVDAAGLPKKDADRARFALSLVTEAAAPTNTLLGNPAAMRQFYETGGASAVRGLTHMIEDIAKNGGMPSQVNMSDFEVGKNLALSKGAVVFKNDVIEVIQYAPQSEIVYARPILFVPPQINKFYILDLAPGKSVVEYLTRNGFSPFTISWRNPTAAQRGWGFDTYVKAVLDAADVVRDISGQEAINILGACAGGATLALALGHLAAKGDKRLNAATFLVTVLDSRVETTMGLFATKETVAAAKLASRARGVLEGQEMARVFAWLRPNDLVWNYWVNNYLIGNDPKAFDILYWNNDTTRLPAKFHGEIMDFALKNPVVKPGAMKVLGTPIDLKRVTVDTFIVGGITDHITPWQGCYATTQLVGGNKEFILSQAGHIQSLVNPPGNPKARYFTHGEYPANPDQWLARAEQHSGSWWDRWRDWLAERSGERVAARATLGNQRHPAGDAAPGTYIFEP